MICVETKIRDTTHYAALMEWNRFFSAISRRYFVDRHIKGMEANKLKRSYLKRFGISGRHYNSLCSEIDARVAAYQARHNFI